MGETSDAIKDQDYSGQRFGYLVALRRDPSNERKWICQCDCGRTVSALIYNLRSGNTKRCGNPDCITKTIDITGQRFGKLVALSFLGFKQVYTDRRRAAMWLCKCDCGKEVEVTYANLHSGHTKSCGCYQVDVQRERMTKHGMSRTRLNKIYRNMKTRCNNPNATGHEYYHDKGITVCQEWEESFESFVEWSMNNGYAPGLTLDRKDNSKGYSPGNCRWVTYKVQSRNTSHVHWINYHGTLMPLVDVAHELGVNPTTFRYHLSKGRSEEDIINYYESRDGYRQRF